MVRLKEKEMTPAQLHHIINCHGLRTPRTKWEKLMDYHNYFMGYKKKDSILKSIYEITIKTV